MNRYYMKSTDSNYVEAFKELRAMATARFHYLHAKAKSLGFDEIAVHDFGADVSFYKKREGISPARKGDTIEGFKGGELTYEKKGSFYRYQLRQNNKTASAIRKDIAAGMPERPVELNGDLYWRRPTISAVFCARYGLPDGIYDGSHSIGYGQVYLLQDSIIACSLPYRDDGSKDAAPAVFPEGFEEITERALVAEIDAHNKALEI